MTSARAIRLANAVWAAAKDAVVVASARTTSKTADKSLEVIRMCSAGCGDVEDGPTVSGRAGAAGGGTEGDESGTEVCSTSTKRTGC